MMLGRACALLNPAVLRYVMVCHAMHAWVTLLQLQHYPKWNSMPNVLATMQHATFLTGATDKQTDTTNQERQ